MDIQKLCQYFKDIEVEISNLICEQKACSLLAYTRVRGVVEIDPNAPPRGKAWLSYLDLVKQVNEKMNALLLTSKNYTNVDEIHDLIILYPDKKNKTGTKITVVNSIYVTGFKEYKTLISVERPDDEITYQMVRHFRKVPIGTKI